MPKKQSSLGAQEQALVREATRLMRPVLQEALYRAKKIIAAYPDDDTDVELVLGSSLGGLIALGIAPLTDECSPRVIVQAAADMIASVASMVDRNQEDRTTGAEVLLAAHRAILRLYEDCHEVLAAEE